MKLARKNVIMIFVIVMMLGLTACGNGSDDAASIRTYTMNGKFNSDVENQFRTIYLVDEDTYILTIEVMHSQDATKHTVDFVMKGTYTDNGNGTITLDPGYGNGYAMNGDAVIPCTNTSAEWDAMVSAIFSVGGATSFTLNDDGTFSPTIN